MVEVVLAFVFANGRTNMAAQPQMAPDRRYRQQNLHLDPTSVNSNLL
jgi:hypothetical protein